ncbi:Long-chain-fatty-acid--CoA ligase [hydrothermal vent metagenome]|uniref:Long-chain-fatty-acid--CoA ligase n=1 Tax=hydrothermal vent metagenome TaxID=652676 RepID=A0A3B0SAA0_9ZZZZ
MIVKAYDWVAHYAIRHGWKTACIDIDGTTGLTYSELDERACRLASFLTSKLLVEKGDRVAILAYNSADYLVLQQACLKTGAILLPLNWRLTAPELIYQVTNSEPKVLIYGDEFADVAKVVAAERDIAHLIEWREEAGDSEFEQAIKSGAADYKSVDVYLDDPWAIMYTSGTTGFPKGAILTHGMAFFNAVSYAIVNHVASDTVNLCFLPLFHTGGLNNCVNPVFHKGGTVILCRQFDPGTVLGLISDPDLAITNVMGVPAIFLMLSQHADFDKTDFSRVVNAPVGGAPVPISMHKLWRSRGVALQEGYGLTEGGPAVIISEIDQPLDKAGAAGKPVLHGELRLVDPDGKDVRRGEIGEIWIRGPAVTPGYWNNPEANAKAFVDGWFCTGDAAYCDEDGYYYIVDRWKDMYISGGENVYPAEVENALYEIEQVAEVAVIGIAEEKWGEVGCAAIVVKPGEVLSEEQVVEHCAGRLARFKIPKKVVFLEALPRNAMNKVLKDTLRDRLGIGKLIKK